MEAQPSDAAEAGGVREPTDDRPSGVEVLAVLSWLAAAAILVVSVVTFTVGGFLSDLVGGGPGSFFLGIGAVVGGMFLLLLGIFNAVVGWGLWTGQGWAWILALVSNGFWGLVGLMDLLSGEIDALLILIAPAAIVWYLFRPWVRRYFGHAA